MSWNYCINYREPKEDLLCRVVGVIPKVECIEAESYVLLFERNK